MLDLLRYIDINLVPLELLPYCEAKSELKFFEAGLASCVTVASATDTYQRAITHGVDGFVCRNTDEWAGALELLCTSAGLRREMGEAARRVALERYAADKYVEQMAEAYGLQIAAKPDTDQHFVRYPRSSLPKVSSQLRGAMILPDLLVGGGGHRKALLMASAAAASGIAIDLIFMNSSQTAEALQDIINGAYYAFDRPIRLFNGSFHGYDWLIATSWTTAYKIVELGFPAERVCYFIQDFEPLFSPMGSEFVKAEATYLAGFQTIGFGQWCSDYLRERYGVKVECLPFPLERQIYNTNRLRPRARRILFFAKPEMARRCFEIGADGLERFHNMCPEVEICFFGSTETRGMNFKFPRTDLGVISDLSQLAELYSSSMLGIAFSTTNPSLVGYEMLACGCPVVDFDRPDTSKVYGTSEIGVVRVRPFPMEIATTLAQLVGQAGRLTAHQNHAASLVEWMPSDGEVASQFVEILARTLLTDRPGQGTSA